MQINSKHILLKPATHSIFEQVTVVLAKFKHFACFCNKMFYISNYKDFNISTPTV